jgi:hypothetical protein
MSYEKKLVVRKSLVFNIGVSVLQPKKSVVPNPVGEILQGFLFYI